VVSIAGPTSPVEVGKDNQNPVLRPSCNGVNGMAVPPLRIDALVQRFGGVTGNICNADFKATLRAAAKLFNP